MSDVAHVFAAVQGPHGTGGPESFTITELSLAFNVTPRAIRFYEDQGLIAPERQGQNRVYSRRDRARLAWILRAKNVGFSPAEIRESDDLDATIEELENFCAVVETVTPRAANA